MYSRNDVILLEEPAAVEASLLMRISLLTQPEIKRMDIE